MATGSPTEIALLVLFAKGQLEADGVRLEYERLAEFPFDSHRKRMSIVVRRLTDGAILLLSKGAPDRLLPACASALDATGAEAPLWEGAQALIVAANHRLASDGLRVLAHAFRRLPGPDWQRAKREELERDMAFAGLVGIEDPPREGVRESVAACQRAGIQVHMLTGDHPATAFAIAKAIGIAPSDLDGAEAGTALMTAADFDALGQYDLDALPMLPVVIARCTPASKVKMVELLHSRGLHVAMTGDGVNDAPAISGAVGIAMGRTGSDVTKEAANIVLAEDDFSTIVAAVEEGRRIFANIRRFVIMYLAGNVGEAIVMVGSVAFSLPPALSMPRRTQRGASGAPSPSTRPSSPPSPRTRGARSF